MTTRPISLLIAALGGEGGGVLTGWIVRAAEMTGFPVQSTSIPGVAQRTGATTYYVEILPVTESELDGKRPVLALTPGVGDIDIAVASELLEGARTVANGFVTADRTVLIASTSRLFAMDEKIAMGDGRLDAEKLKKIIKTHARTALLFDMAEAAKQSGSMISPVMLGAIAGSSVLPIAAETFEAAIEADGKAVAGNLTGFRAGLVAARAQCAADPVAAEKNRPTPTAGALEQAVRRLPAPAQPVVIEGIRRLVPYQSVTYAELYLDRLLPIADADTASGANGDLLKETARHLAVRMSYEDVIKVAAAKIAPARMERIVKTELRATDAEPFKVYDFLKPGIEELTQILPPAIARPIRNYAARRGWLGRVYFGMEINSTSVLGFLRFRILAKFRAIRPYGIRYRDEQVQIEAWLALIVEAAKISAGFALEVAECARLIKGYGDTHARGSANYRTLVERVIRPAIAGQIPASHASDAVASARTAALVDPEGESLARCIADLANTSDFCIAAE